MTELERFSTFKPEWKNPPHAVEVRQKEIEYAISQSALWLEVAEEWAKEISSDAAYHLHYAQHCVKSAVKELNDH